MKSCKGCYFWRALGFNQSIRACHYLLETGKHNPHANDVPGMACESYKSGEKMRQRWIRPTTKRRQKNA